MEERLCQQHNRELELFCLTDHTPVCVLCLAKEHSGHTITAERESESLQSVKAQKTSQRDHLSSFLGKLGLSEFYPNKLTLRSLLEVSHETISDKEVESLKYVPLAFLRKLLMGNTQCRNHASVYFKRQINDCSNADEDERFNPLDLVTALYLCADSCLQQEMSIKMSMCQFAVPFLLPQPGDDHCTLMLWALRNINKEWRCPQPLLDTSTYEEDSVVHAQIPLISFVHLKDCTLSKSQILNHVLCNTEQNINFFMHREMNGGSVPRRIANGLVEIVWCLPCGKNNIDVFPEPVAIANMRGDIRSNETQFNFLMHVSTAVFVFVDIITEEEEKFLDLEDPLKSKLFIVVNSKIEEPSIKSDALNLQRKQILRRKAQLNTAEFSSVITGAINMVLKECKDTITIEKMSETVHNFRITVDEFKHTASKTAADGIIQGIGISPVHYKKQQLFLQGEYLKQISKIELDECRLPKPGDRSVEKYKIDLRTKKSTLRKEQGARKTSNAMQQFIQALSTEDNERKLLFLKWMALNLNRKSQKRLLELRRQFQNEKESKSITNLCQEIFDNSLGIEHYMREMGQIYESKQLNDRNLKDLISVAAELLLDGYPMELLDGDTFNIPIKWVTNVLTEVHKKVKMSRLLVISVLGVQSTGKSTLLNTMFGAQFPVSSGRCTRGAYMLFLSVGQDVREELKCDFVVLIDTEGLKAPERAKLEDSHEHDNQFATFVIGLSDVTIVNMAMENVVEMKEILQIAVLAFMRMKKLGKKPICHFVHQNVSGVAAHDKLMTDRKHLLDQLNEMTKIAADMEKQPKVRRFTDVLDYDVEKNNWYIPGLWNGTPPMAPVNSGYSQAVHDFKKNLFESVKTTHHRHISEIPDSLQWMTSLWESVKYENFIFSFRNVLVAYAYDNLCKAFSEWEWSLKKSVYLWLNNALPKISNTDTINIQDLLKVLTVNANKRIDDERTKMKTSLEEYFKDNNKKYVNLVERYRTEFEISVDKLCLELTNNVINELEFECELKVKMDQVIIIQKQHTEIIEKQVMKLLKICKNREAELSNSDLNEEFHKMWSEVTKDISPTIKEMDISSSVMKQLSINMSRRNVQEQLSKINDISNCGQGKFKVKKAHIKLFDQVVSFFTRQRIKSDVQDAADNIIESCNILIEEIAGKNRDYNDFFSKQLLNKIDTHPLLMEKRTNKMFEIDLKVHICGIASRKFLEMHRHFWSKKNPLQQLEECKEQYLRHFIDSYRQKDQCQRKALDFTQLCIKPAILQYINRTLGIEIVDKMLSSSNSLKYRSRSSFQYTLLAELLEKDDFTCLMKCILHYEFFVKDWIYHQIIEWLAKDKTLEEMKRKILANITEKITEKIKFVHREAKSDSDSPAAVFLQKLCSTLGEDLLLPSNTVLFPQILSRANCKTTPFVDSLSLSLSELTNDLYKELEESINTQDLLNDLTVKPQDEIFKKVFGCGVQCPFCKIPCEAGGKGHTQHHATVHRPQALAGNVCGKTGTLDEQLCSTCVYSEASFKNHETNMECYPFKEYRVHYPNWNIAPDPSIQASDYWKYVLVRYNDKFAEHYKVNPAVCPEEWHRITKEQALGGLKVAFNVY